MKTIKITYGSDAKHCDVTKDALFHFLQNGKFSVPQSVQFNSLFGDPHYGVAKKLCLYVQTSPQELQLVAEIAEKRPHNFSIDLFDRSTCVAVLVHCFNDKAWPDLENAIENIVNVADQCCVVMTVDASNNNCDKYRTSWKTQFEKKHAEKNRRLHVKVIACENRGMDIGGFFVACEYLQQRQQQCLRTIIAAANWPEHDIVVFKLHSKSNDQARRKMLHNLCDTANAVRQTLKTMQDCAAIGIVGNNLRQEEQKTLAKNAQHLCDLAHMSRIKPKQQCSFVAGTIFAMRWTLLQSMFDDLGPPRMLMRLLNDQQTIDINWHRHWRMAEESNSDDSTVREHCVLQNKADGSLLSATNLGAHERDGMIEHAFERFFGAYTTAKEHQIVACTTPAKFDQQQQQPLLQVTKNVCVGIATSHSGKNPNAGDLFTGTEFGEALKKTLGWTVKYLDDGPEWYYSTQCDVVVAMLHNFQPSKMQNRNTKLVAWIRNWHSGWVKQQDFNMYSIVLVSSAAGAEYVRKNSTIPSEKIFVLPLAVNASTFQADTDNDEKRTLAYSTTISYWGARRLFCDFDPSKVPHRGELYGQGWRKFRKLEPMFGGFLDYKALPALYASSKIVIDDSNHVTAPWGALNSRIFDALAAGALVVTNNVIGAQELFCDDKDDDAQLPTYESAEQLEQLLCRLLSENEYRKFLAKKLQKKVLQKHTYVHRAMEFARILASCNALPRDQ